MAGPSDLRSPSGRKSLFKRLFQRPRPSGTETPLVDGRAPRLPEGLRVYAIGDVHGRIDLLEEIEGQIVADAAHGPGRPAGLVVYLGDYVDRGLASRAVLDHLIDEPLDGFERVLLLGNHDAWFKAFIDGDPIDPAWLRYGGDATLSSYGVGLSPDQPEAERLTAAYGELVERLPASHRTFLAGLEPALSLGDYFFCHAGVRPGVALAAQSDHDLLWIRDPFLGFDGSFGKIVVHGHTVEDAPVVRSNRIGIDTGACFCGNLTCLVLEGTSFRFMSTIESRPAAG